MELRQEGNDAAPIAYALAFTVPQFCEAHGISRALFYLMRRDGTAPTIMKVGRRTLVSKESAAAWRRRMEQGAAP